MKNYFTILLVSLISISCNNKDVVIQNSGNTCDVNEQDGIHIRLEGMEETHSIELKNNSETKVYKVVVKIINKGKVEFKNYTIEPTDLIQLGCDKDFGVTYIPGAGTAEGIAYTSNISKYNIIYKIQSVDLIREY